MRTMPVIAGVDGSEESMRAAQWAAQEARRHRAPLQIVSAADGGTGTVADELRRESARGLSEAVSRSAGCPRLPIDVSLLTGPPALAVADVGTGALMLVVGARGSGGFAAMLLGSVSRYAAMHACCPVVVVRDEEAGGAHPEVVVGIRDPQDTAALSFAFDEADLRGATLVALHSWNGLPAATRPPAKAAQLAAEADRNLAEALEPWRDKYPAVPIRPDVVHDHPARVLACYSRRADLVVIGRQAGGGGAVVGGIEHAVLSHARGPVAVVPSG